MTKKGQKRYLSDRATKELFQIKEFRDKIIGGILGDKFTKNELQALDIRINNNANFRDSQVDFGYRNKSGIVNVECNYDYSKESENKNFTYINQLVLSQTKHSTYFKYSNLKDVSQININNFDIHNKGKFIYSAGVIDKEIHKVRSSLITIYDVNVDYLYHMGYNNVIKKFGKDSLEYYLLVFTCENKEQVNKVFKGGGKIVKKIREAVNKWDNDDFWITREDILSSYFVPEERERVREEAHQEQNIKNALDFYKDGVDLKIILKNTEKNKRSC